ncbi:hypothetical protein HY523_01860, partial [Candidatus Berkelbacteria bacterium]|nr:hypothetical protein [Candidatus Berkelbacteria bacterium]
SHTLNNAPQKVVLDQAMIDGMRAITKRNNENRRYFPVPARSDLEDTKPKFHSPFASPDGPFDPFAPAEFIDEGLATFLLARSKAEAYQFVEPLFGTHALTGRDIFDTPLIAHQYLLHRAGIAVPALEADPDGGIALYTADRFVQARRVAFELALAADHLAIPLDWLSSFAPPIGSSLVSVPAPAAGLPTVLSTLPRSMQQTILELVDTPALPESQRAYLTTLLGTSPNPNLTPTQTTSRTTIAPSSSVEPFPGVSGRPGSGIIPTGNLVREAVQGDPRQLTAKQLQEIAREILANNSSTSQTSTHYQYKVNATTVIEITTGADLSLVIDAPAFGGYVNATLIKNTLNNFRDDLTRAVIVTTQENSNRTTVTQTDRQGLKQYALESSLNEDGTVHYKEIIFDTAGAIKEILTLELTDEAGGTNVQVTSHSIAGHADTPEGLKNLEDAISGGLVDEYRIRARIELGQKLYDAVTTASNGPPNVIESIPVQETTRILATDVYDSSGTKLGTAGEMSRLADGTNVVEIAGQLHRVVFQENFLVVADNEAVPVYAASTGQPLLGKYGLFLDPQRDEFAQVAISGGDYYVSRDNEGRWILDDNRWSFVRGLIDTTAPTIFASAEEVGSLDQLWAHQRGNIYTRIDADGVESVLSVEIGHLAGGLRVFHDSLTGETKIFQPMADGSLLELPKASLVPPNSAEALGGHLGLSGPRYRFSGLIDALPGQEFTGQVFDAHGERHLGEAKIWSNADGTIIATLNGRSYVAAFNSAGQWVLTETRRVLSPSGQFVDRPTFTNADGTVYIVSKGVAFRLQSFGTDTWIVEEGIREPLSLPDIVPVQPIGENKDDDEPELASAGLLGLAILLSGQQILDQPVLIPLASTTTPSPFGLERSAAALLPTGGATDSDRYFRFDLGAGEYVLDFQTFGTTLSQDVYYGQSFAIRLVAAAQAILDADNLPFATASPMALSESILKTKILWGLQTASGRPASGLCWFNRSVCDPESRTTQVQIIPQAFFVPDGTVILIHEYLHSLQTVSYEYYANNVQLIEGLTEFLARKIYREQFRGEPGSGAYNAYVQVFEALDQALLKFYQDDRLAVDRYWAALNTSAHPVEILEEIFPLSADSTLGLTVNGRTYYGLTELLRELPENGQGLISTEMITTIIKNFHRSPDGAGSLSYSGPRSFVNEDEFLRQYQQMIVEQAVLSQSVKAKPVVQKIIDWIMRQPNTGKQRLAELKAGIPTFYGLAVQAGVDPAQLATIKEAALERVATVGITNLASFLARDFELAEPVVSAGAVVSVTALQDEVAATIVSDQAPLAILEKGVRDGETRLEATQRVLRDAHLDQGIIADATLADLVDRAHGLDELWAAQGVVGLDGKNPPALGNYTTGQKVQKLLILTRAFEQADPHHNRTLALQKAKALTQAEIVGKPFLPQVVVQLKDLQPGDILTMERQGGERTQVRIYEVMDTRVTYQLIENGAVNDDKWQFLSDIGKNGQLHYRKLGGNVFTDEVDFARVSISRKPKTSFLDRLKQLFQPDSFLKEAPSENLAVSQNDAILGNLQDYGVFLIHTTGNPLEIVQIGSLESTYRQNIREKLDPHLERAGGAGGSSPYVHFTLGQVYGGLDHTDKAGFIVDPASLVRRGHVIDLNLSALQYKSEKTIADVRVASPDLRQVPDLTDGGEFAAELATSISIADMIMLVPDSGRQDLEQVLHSVASQGKPVPASVWYYPPNPDGTYSLDAGLEWFKQAIGARTSPDLLAFRAAIDSQLIGEAHLVQQIDRGRKRDYLTDRFEILIRLDESSSYSVFYSYEPKVSERQTSLVDSTALTDVIQITASKAFTEEIGERPIRIPKGTYSLTKILKRNGGMRRNFTPDEVVDGGVNDVARLRRFIPMLIGSYSSVTITPLVNPMSNQLQPGTLNQSSQVLQVSEPVGAATAVASVTALQDEVVATIVSNQAPLVILEKGLRERETRLEAAQRVLDVTRLGQGEISDAALTNAVDRAHGLDALWAAQGVVGLDGKNPPAIDNYTTGQK